MNIGIISGFRKSTERYIGNNFMESGTRTAINSEVIYEKLSRYAFYMDPTNHTLTMPIGVGFIPL